MGKGSGGCHREPLVIDEPIDSNIETISLNEDNLIADIGIKPNSLSHQEFSKLDSQEEIIKNYKLINEKICLANPITLALNKFSNVELRAYENLSNIYLQINIPYKTKLYIFRFKEENKSLKQSSLYTIEHNSNVVLTNYSKIKNLSSKIKPLYNQAFEDLTKLINSNEWLDLKKEVKLSAKRMSMASDMDNLTYNFAVYNNFGDISLTNSNIQELKYLEEFYQDNFILVLKTYYAKNIVDFMNLYKNKIETLNYKINNPKHTLLQIASWTQKKESYQGKVNSCQWLIDNLDDVIDDVIENYKG